VSRRVALVSSERGLRVDPDLPLAAPALREAGLTVDCVRWDDPAVDWAGHDLVVVRSCWDYAWRRAEFLAWADAVPRLRNDAAVLRWNTDKTHLRDVEAAGLPVVPTVWDPTTADELPDAAEWVVKPSVSAGSRDTARWTDPADVLAHAAELAAAGRTAMVQPYQASVDDVGETALLFLGGEFSHAARKAPLLGRGEGVRQDRDSRGGVRPATATPEQREVAQAVVDAVPTLVRDALTSRGRDAAPLLYARIDLVADAAGRPVILEIELTEPNLFLPQAPPEARTRLAHAVGDAIAA
jgi:glutathione synthase/RimK-type ligase-like ATP-grasp enzyme